MSEAAGQQGGPPGAAIPHIGAIHPVPRDSLSKWVLPEVSTLVSPRPGAGSCEADCELGSKLSKQDKAFQR